MENYAVDYDQVSLNSHNSLDENDVDEKRTASTDADRTLPSRHTLNNGFLSPSHLLINTDKIYSNGSRTLSQPSKTSTLQKNGEPNGSVEELSDGLYESRGTSPPPNYPQPIMASLESTEL